MAFFSIGRDKKFRPVLYLYPNKLKSDQMEKFQQFLQVYLAIIQKYIFRPYYIENWVMIIDVEKKGLINFPWKALKSIIDTTNLNFSSRMHKMFIVNPSFIFNTTWSIIKGLIDSETARKISFVKRHDFKVLQDVIPKDQLLKEYGGDMEKPDTAFPIKKTVGDSAMPVLTEEETKTDNIIIENSYMELKSNSKVKLKHIHLIAMDEDIEELNIETRSLQVFDKDSQFSREMTRISSYSLTRGDIRPYNINL